MDSEAIREEGGFSLVELMVVVTIIAVLMVLGIAAYTGMTRLAHNEAAQSDAVAAVKVQMVNHHDTGSFTDDAAVLAAIEPTLQYSVAGDYGTVAIRLEPGREVTDVCVFVQTPTGDWFAVHHSDDGGDRFAEVGPVACTPANVGGWSAESW